MKFIGIALVVSLVALFTPSYELRVLTEPFSEEYRKVDSYLLFRDDCIIHARDRQYIDLKPICIKSTLWNAMRNTSGKYREARDPSDLGI